MFQKSRRSSGKMGIQVDSVLNMHYRVSFWSHKDKLVNQNVHSSCYDCLELCNQALMKVIGLSLFLVKNHGITTLFKYTNVNGLFSIISTFCRIA